MATQVRVRAYPGKTQEAASAAFVQEANKVAAEGWTVLSQSWAPGGRTPVAGGFVGFGVLLIVGGFLLPPLFLVGIVVLVIGLVSGKGPGTLSVTYQHAA